MWGGLNEKPTNSRRSECGTLVLVSACLALRWLGRDTLDHRPCIFTWAIGRQNKLRPSTVKVPEWLSSKKVVF
jgi:hypothetical protein